MVAIMIPQIRVSDHPLRSTGPNRTAHLETGIPRGCSLYANNQSPCAATRLSPRLPRGVLLASKRKPR